MVYKILNNIFMMNSKIYKEISNDDMCKITRDLYGTDTKIVTSRVLKGGLFNTTYFIKTNKEEEGIVLRVAPINKHLLFNFEKDMMSVEPHFHQLLKDNDIPTSNILKYAPEGKVIEREYIVSEFIDSIPMNDPSLKDVDLGYVYEKVGDLSQRIHSIKGNKFGWKRKNRWGEYDRWSGFILAFAKEAADKAEYYKLFSKLHIKMFRDMFEGSIDILDKVSTPFMTHTDLWPGNVLIKKTEDRYKVVGIIDLDRTIFGDVYWDLACPWMINEAFIKGYNKDILTTHNHMQRKHLYKLLIVFFTSYACLIEYDAREWFEEEKQNAINLLNEL